MTQKLISYYYARILYLSHIYLKISLNSCSEEPVPAPGFYTINLYYLIGSTDMEAAVFHQVI